MHRRLHALGAGLPGRSRLIDAAAVQGMLGCLKHDLPDLVIEVTDAYLRALGSSAASLMLCLTALGYSMYRIAHDRLVPIRSVADLGANPDQFNAFFTVKPAGT